MIAAPAMNPTRVALDKKSIMKPNLEHKWTGEEDTAYILLTLYSRAPAMLKIFITIKNSVFLLIFFFHKNKIFNVFKIDLSNIYNGIFRNRHIK